MVKILIVILPALIFWGIFVYVVFQIPYPENITQANPTQLVGFFIPLYLAITFTLKAFLKNIFISGSISLGLLLLLILKALDSLNLVTGVLVIISVVLLVSYFGKMKKKSLTKLPKISKITHLRRRYE
ncbi:hypothetical protein HYZ05_01585 [Candidatus Daviesbacteria bacterium]|nr:hypothetical protein [Candidatus Daviesbacteria bacterium]